MSKCANCAKSGHCGGASSEVQELVKVSDVIAPKHAGHASSILNYFSVDVFKAILTILAMNILFPFWLSTLVVLGRLAWKNSTYTKCVQKWRYNLLIDQISYLCASMDLPFDGKEASLLGDLPEQNYQSAHHVFNKFASVWKEKNNGALPTRTVSFLCQWQNMIVDKVQVQESSTLGIYDTCVSVVALIMLRFFDFKKSVSDAVVMKSLEDRINKHAKPVEIDAAGRVVPIDFNAVAAPSMVCKQAPVLNISPYEPDNKPVMKPTLKVLLRNAAAKRAANDPETARVCGRVLELKRILEKQGEGEEELTPEENAVFEAYQSEGTFRVRTSHTEQVPGVTKNEEILDFVDQIHFVRAGETDPAYYYVFS